MNTAQASAIASPEAKQLFEHLLQRLEQAQPEGVTIDQVQELFDQVATLYHERRTGQHHRPACRG
jgi:hypothetical protein